MGLGKTTYNLIVDYAGQIVKNLPGTKSQKIANITQKAFGKSLFMQDKAVCVNPLQNLYSGSQKICTELSNSVKSKTLSELFTDEFRPSVTKSGKTTIKSLLTGKPVEVTVAGELLGGASTKSSHIIRFNMIKNENLLGYKKFGIRNLSKTDKEFLTGYIESYSNNIVAGTQIRLLQAAIEDASKNGITHIPLKSLIPAAVYHTKMGFRPVESYSKKISSVNDIPKIIKKNRKLFQRFNFSADEITPIVSMKDGKYYFDLNRTLYCSAMKHNKNLLNATGQNNLKLTPETSYNTIDMVLEGKEYDAWLKRIKGFEITSEGNVPMLKENIFHKIRRKIIAAVVGV